MSGTRRWTQGAETGRMGPREPSRGHVLRVLSPTGRRSMMRGIRPLLITGGLLALSAVVVLAAASTMSIWIAAGTTVFDFAGTDVRVESTGGVIVHLSQEDGEVVGRVELAPGSSGARVKITLVDDPDRIIFEGRVVAPSWFADYLPHETGRGEQ